MNNGLRAKASEYWFVFRQCRGVSSRLRLVSFAAAIAAAKIAGRMRPGNRRGHSESREFFLRLRRAGFWCADRSELKTYREVFAASEYDLHDVSPAAGEMILDVGANIGLFTMRYARAFPAARLYAFEPNPGVYSRLVRNLEVNRVTNAVAINAALAESAGRRPFFVGPLSVTGSLVDKPGRRATPAFIADVIDLGSFCRAHRIASIGLLKIDVEGAEMQVLRGAESVLGITRALMIECHSEALAAAVEALLVNRGFAVNFRKVHWPGLSTIHFARERALNHDTSAAPERRRTEYRLE